MKKLFALIVGLALVGCSHQKQEDQGMLMELGARSLSELETSGLLPGTSGQISRLCQEALKTAAQMVEELIRLETRKRTFENTIARVDELMDSLNTSGSAAYLLMEVHPDAAVREEAQKCVLEIEKYANALMLRRDFYEAVTKKKFTGLRGEDLVYYKDLLLGFKRSGVHLSEAKRKHLQELRDQLSKIETDFSKNIATDQTKLKFRAEDLKGMPTRSLESLKKEGSEYILGMDYPTVTAVMEYVEIEETRKQVQKAFLNRAYPANIPLLNQVVSLRHEIASILGYKTYADYQLEDLMAKNVKSVRVFLDDLRKRARVKALEDLKDMEAMKKKISGDPKATVMPWDKAFVRQKIKEEKYNIDEQKIAEYFPVEATVKGLFEVSQKLFAIRFRETDPSWKWHEDVKFYDVISEDSGKVIGKFYTDLFPRDNKYNHAAKFGIVSGRQAGKGYRIPVVAIVANFPKPTPSTPALLKHDDVETFFHEFGHCLHSMLTEAKYAAHSGTSVDRDFVEAPSQMLENWVWNKESLSLFAKHYKTGEVIPDKILNAMMSAKFLNSGLDTQQQIYYSELSLDMFASGPKVDSDELIQALHKKNTLFPYFEGTHFQAAFGHLTGYGAGYYGYQWSKVYAEDMFTKFDGKNILNTKVGLAYRKKVLARGSGRDEMKSVVDFLGRKPNSKAYFKSLGFEESKGKRSKK